jgi:hypothetical protein
MARSCRTRPVPTRDLDAVARQLDAVADQAGWGGPPLLIGLTAEGAHDASPPTPKLGAAGTDPDDLVGALVGFVAPPDWEAMAVVVHGRAWLLDDRSVDPSPVRLTHVVDRDGRVASVVRHQGRPPADPIGPGEGRLVDVCRRALGLPTPPPPEDSTELWALMWLDNLLARVARGERIRGLVAAAHAHPAIELVAEHEPRLLDEAIGRLVRLGTLLGTQRSWPNLRRAAAAGEWDVERLTAEGAAWMDDGLFARWVLADFPPVDDYLAELSQLLAEPVVDGVRGVLSEWDLVP